VSQCGSSGRRPAHGVPRPWIIADPVRIRDWSAAVALRSARIMGDPIRQRINGSRITPTLLASSRLSRPVVFDPPAAGLPQLAGRHPPPPAGREAPCQEGRPRRKEGQRRWSGGRPRPGSRRPAIRFDLESDRLEGQGPRSSRPMSGSGGRCRVARGIATDCRDSCRDAALWGRGTMPRGPVP
jgi:hypothetical protein